MRRKPKEMNLHQSNNRWYLTPEDSIVHKHEVIGMELELLFAPSSYLQRDLSRRLQAVDKQIINEFVELREKVRQYLGFKLSPLVEDEAELDGINHEWKFYPISHEAIIKAADEIGDMFSFLTSIGYVDYGPFETIGIHHNIDLEMLGQERTTQVFTLRRYLDFIYLIKDKMEILSLRKHTSTYLSDIDFMLGDRYTTSPPEYIANRFKQEREIMSRYLLNGDWCKMMGIILFPNDRPIMEIRYFGSTFRVSEFIAIYEFTMGAILYCKKTESPSWNGFFDFIKERKYNYLKEFILEYKLI